MQFFLCTANESSAQFRNAWATILASRLTFGGRFLFRSNRRTSSVLLSFLVFACTHAFALMHHNQHRSVRRRSHHRRLLWNPLLRGSHESMLRQNEEIDRLGLPRIADDEQLELLEQRRELMPIEATRELRIHPQLEPKNRYCRPWTLDFLHDFSSAFYQEFHQPIQVNSAVRTVEQQHRLRRHNRNAAPETGDTASSHLAGLTVDISKRGINRREKKWINAYLLKLKDQNLIEGAEERRQAVFHIMVSERYGEWRTARNEAAETATTRDVSDPQPPSPLSVVPLDANKN